MSPSRTARLYFLLVLDLLFFVLEISIGYAVGSLALVADSFHMLNDVVSLIIALYAIKLTASSTPTTRYSYGWHRAEILAALVNGVFLLALCFTITLEALERFFSTPEISNPKLVVLVGSLGLISNILGLCLFHEHAHGHDHSNHSAKSSRAPSVHSATLESVTPEASPVAIRQPRPPAHHTGSHSSLYGHPAATRASFVQTANKIARSSSPVPADRTHKSRTRHSLDIWSPDSVIVTSLPYEHEERQSRSAKHAAPADAPHEQTSLLERPPVSYTGSTTSSSRELSSSDPKGHGHLQGQPHGGSMNMKALVLHVLGDALGNVGVIATGLVIWLTSWSFKYYCDPIISLVITVIIFHSALPLVRSTSFILLQGVPPEVSLEDVRSDILAVEGVHSVHELHIWQLSETKIIASVHINASREVEFMPIASEIRRVLHTHGIHSSTIQPEYHPIRDAVLEERSKYMNCLISCPADSPCSVEQACCPSYAGTPPEPEP
ncbi:cation efflux protein [Russula emetica]|nr:cation efflux protein [Russula emetica]